jgi:thiopurine S-methyltransferase
MGPDFRHDKWQKNQIGFHQVSGNPLLQKHLRRLDLPIGARVFLPLCGKTGDIGWLLGHGLHVVGAELSRTAIEQLFETLDVTPAITDIGKMTRFSAPNIDIFVGDIFHLKSSDLGEINAIYDRAAYVGLPRDMRQQYADHLISLTGAAPQLLITFNYDPANVSGPPFAITPEEIGESYSATYKVSVLETLDLENGIKGVTPATETIWHLV